jgi:hypothetical protein
MNKLDGTLLSTININTLFWYITIFVIILFIFSKLNIGLNNILGVIVGLLIILYLYTDYKRIEHDDQIIYEEKKKSIFPTPIRSMKYKDIVNYLYSIQDFYKYNPEAYIEFINNIDYFFLIYDDVQYENSAAGVNYNMMIEHKKNALNALQSIIFKLPRNVKYDRKLNNAQYMLNIILDKYCEDIKKVYDNYVYTNGYTNKTVLLDPIKGPVSKNTYDDTLHSYIYH